jgi:hypothetical protein
MTHGLFPTWAPSSFGQLLEYLVVAAVDLHGMQNKFEALSRGPGATLP